MASLGWFHDELVLSDSDKLEYVPRTAKRACRLTPQLVVDEDFSGNALPANWSVFDTGGKVTFADGVMTIAGDGGFNANGVITEGIAPHPGYVEYTSQFNHSALDSIVGFTDDNAALSTALSQPGYNIDSRLKMRLGGTEPAGPVVDADTVYTFRHYYQFRGTDTPSGMQYGVCRLTIQGGDFTDETLVFEYNTYADPTSPWYFMWQSHDVNRWQTIDNFKWYSGYDPSGVPAYVVKDAGEGEVWDGSALATLAASLALPDGYDYTNVTFDYSYDDGTPSWTTGRTLAQLKTAMEAINTDKRYFRLRGNLNSDGDTQVVMMLPDMPEVPLARVTDIPDAENVAPDDTVDGLAGTMDLPELENVLNTDTLRGEAGTYSPSATTSQTKTGVRYARSGVR